MAQSSPASAALHDDPGLGPGLSPTPGAELARGQPASSAPVTGSATASGFVAVSPRGEDQGDTMVTLVAAYALMWLILFGFVWILARRQARVTAQLAQLEQGILRPRIREE